MPIQSRVASVTLVLPSRVPDLLSAWYVQNLGFEPVDGRLHSGPVALEFVESEPTRFERARLRLDLVSPEAVAEIHARLEAGGAVVSPIAGDTGRPVVRVVDPEGNLIEVGHG